MSTSTAPNRPAGRPPAPAVSGTSVLGSAGSAPARGPRGLASTPNALRLLLALAVVASLAAAVAGWRTAELQADALAGARQQAQRVLGLQDVRNDLVAADSTATTTFLVGGLEEPQQRARYDELVASAASSIASLAEAGSAQDLGAVSADLATYAGLIEQARAANRQGFPVGTAYLAQASRLMQDDLLPTLDTVVLAAADDASDDLGTVGSASWLLLAALLAAVVLAIGHTWLARRTHRRINLGLAAALVLVLLGGGVAAGLGTSAARTAQQARTGPYHAALAVSQATALAHEARAAESFTLIRRGSGQAYEAAFVVAADDAQRQLTRAAAADSASGTQELATSFTAWRALHEQVRALDDGGDWDGAVAMVTSADADGPAAAFDAFESAAAAVVQSDSALALDRWEQAGRSAGWAGWVLVAAGLVAAVTAWRGVQARLEEYR